MKPKKRQKLCHNCEGEVDLEVIFCPYCGSDLLEDKPTSPHEPTYERPLTLNSENPLYPPPYTPKKGLEEPSAEETVMETTLTEEVPPAKNPFWPVILLTLGLQALLLGILLFVFSENGAVRLKFDAKTWLFYVLFSMPLLYFGWKKLESID